MCVCIGSNCLSKITWNKNQNLVILMLNHTSIITSSSFVLLGSTLLKYFMHQVVRAFLDTLLLLPMYKYTSLAGKT